MNKRILAAMLAALALGLAGGCEHSGRGGKSDAGPGSIVYTGTTAKNETLTLTITEKAAGNTGILASEAGTDDAAAVYMPKTGDSYTITIADELVSSGTVYVSAAAWIITFYAGGDTAKSFYAALTASDGGRTLKFSTAIKTIDGGTVSVSTMSAAVTPIAPWTPSAPVVQTPAPPAPPAYTPPPYVPPAPPDPIISLSGTHNFQSVEGGRVRSSTDDGQSIESVSYAASEPLEDERIEKMTYVAPAPLTITITNKGEQETGALTVALTGNSDAFTLSTATIASIPVGENNTATFEVRANTGLDLNYYESEITVSSRGITWATFSVNFLVATSAPDFAALIGNMDGYKKNANEAYVLLAANADTHTVSSLASDKWPSAWPATVVIDGNGSGITVGSGVTLPLQNITFKNLPFTVAGGGTLKLNNGAVIRDYRGNATTGVTVTGGTLEMNAGSVITNNSNGGRQGGGGDEGGGVRINGGAFTMNGGEISGNSAGPGGGVYMNANSTFTMYEGAIITRNSASGAGGGVRMDGGTFTMSGGEISWNTATDGGGVALRNGGTANMSGGSINNNTANNGGGVWIGSGVSAIFNMTGGEITGNKANESGGGVVGTITGGDPWIGSNKESGSGPGWIYGNTPSDR